MSLTDISKQTKIPISTIFDKLKYYAKEIIKKTALTGETIDRLLYKQQTGGETVIHENEVPFYKRQERIIFGFNGKIDPLQIEDYLTHDGYMALSKVLFEKKPAEIIAEVTRSGLRGRGGGGFLTGKKWELCGKSADETKYVICNADEGDPGAFMDRSIIEADPHSIIEGMSIGAYAIGATEGYIYIRIEYPLAIERITTAIERAKEYCLLGENIFGTDFSFDIHIFEGAGAFVCGEETALIASIEGKRGMPKPRPPLDRKSTRLNSSHTVIS